MKESFIKELEQVINKHGVDNELNTPDFILAQYVVRCFANLGGLMAGRDTWFGFWPFEKNKGELDAGKASNTPVL